MSSEPKDITDIVLKQSELPRDIEAVRKQCLALPMVSDCQAALSSFKGRPIENGRYQVDICGTLKVKTRMLVAMTFDAAGTGEIDSSGQNLHITDVRITNDFHGLFNKLLDMTGLVTGRTLRLRAGDSALIRAALIA